MAGRLAVDEYPAYMGSPEWAAKREEWRDAHPFGRRCRVCLTRPYELHHRTYAHLGHEKVRSGVWVWPVASVLAAAALVGSVVALVGLVLCGLGLLRRGYLRSTAWFGRADLVPLCRRHHETVSGMHRRAQGGYLSVEAATDAVLRSAFWRVATLPVAAAVVVIALTR